MHNEEFVKICDELYSSSEILLDKINSIYKSKSTWTIDELGKITDMVKDISECYKNLAKVHKIIAENPIERY